MTATFERTLQNYGELAVRVGLNLRAGQRLLIIGPIANGGVSLEAAPLVRAITASAYAAGCPLVETLWGDEAMQLERFRYAPRDAFTEFSAWLPDALAGHVTGGHAVLSVNANDPDLLKDQPADLIGAVQRTVSQRVHVFREQISRNQTNWSVIAAPSKRWAMKVFPGAPPDRAVEQLWDAIIRLCRLDRPDPLAAWQAHLDALAARRDLLNRKQ
jgi:aminopeptidase